jgi:hypothetical protein
MNVEQPRRATKSEGPEVELKLEECAKGSFRITTGQYLATSLEYTHPSPRLSEAACGHAPSIAGADDDDVVLRVHVADGTDYRVHGR